MADLSWFDPNQVPDQEDFKALPEGQYVAIATNSEEKVTKAGTGKYLQITFEVMDGPHKGRRLWSRLNLWNQNQTAKDMAQRELKAISSAVLGDRRPNDSAELHNKPMLIDVVVEIDDRKRENNVIKRYHPLAPQAASYSPPPAAAASAPAGAAPGGMPWAR